MPSDRNARPSCPSRMVMRATALSAGPFPHGPAGQRVACLTHANAIPRLRVVSGRLPSWCSRAAELPPNASCLVPPGCSCRLGAAPMPPGAYASPRHAFPQGAPGPLGCSKHMRRMSRSLDRGLPEASPMRPEHCVWLVGASRIRSQITSQPPRRFLHGVAGPLVARQTQCGDPGETSRGFPARARWRARVTSLPPRPSAHGSAGCALLSGHSAGAIGRPRVAFAHLPTGTRQPRVGSPDMLRMSRSAARGLPDAVSMRSDGRSWPSGGSAHALEPPLVPPPAMRRSHCAEPTRPVTVDSSMRLASSASSACVSTAPVSSSSSK
jgi:hypothetical protein